MCCESLTKGRKAELVVHQWLNEHDKVESIETDHDLATSYSGSGAALMTVGSRQISCPDFKVRFTNSGERWVEVKSSLRINCAQLGRYHTLRRLDPEHIFDLFFVIKRSDGSWVIRQVQLENLKVGGVVYHREDYDYTGWESYYPVLPVCLKKIGTVESLRCEGPTDTPTAA